MKKHNSISHFTGMEQNALHCIKNRIVERLQPLIIYCFDSSISTTIQRSCFPLKKKSEEHNFTCKLLVVLSDETTIEDSVIKEIEEITAPYGKATVITHTLAVIIEKLKESNLFFSWIHRSAVTLYEKNNATKLLPTPISGRQEYREQAERFYSENPDLANYMRDKLAIVNPVIAEVKDKPQPIEIRLFLEFVDGKLQLTNTPTS